MSANRRRKEIILQEDTISAFPWLSLHGAAMKARMILKLPLVDWLAAYSGFTDETAMNTIIDAFCLARGAAFGDSWDNQMVAMYPGWGGAATPAAGDFGLVNDLDTEWIGVPLFPTTGDIGVDYSPGTVYGKTGLIPATYFGDGTKYVNAFKTYTEDNDGSGLYINGVIESSGKAQRVLIAESFNRYILAAWKLSGTGQLVKSQIPEPNGNGTHIRLDNRHSFRLNKVEETVEDGPDNGDVPDTRDIWRGCGDNVGVPVGPYNKIVAYDEWSKAHADDNYDAAEDAWNTMLTAMVA